MAEWSFATGNALTRKVWHKKWRTEAKTESYFYNTKMVGTDEDNDIFVEYDELEKEQGDKITYGQIRELTGSGVLNDATMEGNEETPSTYDDDLTLTMQRNAIKTAGRLNMQRPSDGDYRQWAVKILKRWYANTLDQKFFTALGTSSTKALYGGDATSTATIEAGDYMTLYVIAKAVAYAHKASPKIIGPSFGGKHYNGVMVIGPDQSFDLTERDAAWSDKHMNAAQRGPNNAMFTGALGMHKNVPIHEHDRCPVSTTWGSGSNLTGATGFFMGVGAGAVAYGKKWIWNEKTFDYGNQVGFCAGMMCDVSKTVFNSADNALVEIRTYRSNN